MGEMGAGPPEGRGEAGNGKIQIMLLLFLLGFFLILSSSFSLPLTARAAVTDTKKQNSVPAVGAPNSILQMGDQQPAYALLVDKSLQRLYLYQQEAEGLKLARTFPCATGENAGPKMRRGDKRTPEGAYFFTRVIESNKLAPIYGIRAFPMDYPNFLDRRDDHNGDGIWLHGTDKPLTPTSTNGCIVLENQDVAELSKYIRFRQTPIVIREKISSATIQELNEERGRVLRIIAEWKKSWESKALDRYMSFYSKKFRSRDLDWAGWRNYKARLNQQYKTIQVSIETPMILRHKENLVVLFYQRYRSDRFASEGNKRLYLVSEGGDYRILGEESETHKGGEAPPPIPPAVLTAFLTPKSPPKPKAEPAPAPPLRPSIESKAEPKVESKPEKAPGAVVPEVPEVRTFLAGWHQSWEKKDLTRYMDCYSKNFRGQGKGWEQWKQHKKGLNARYRQIQVALEDVQIKKVGDQVMVSFRQVYRSDSLKSTGLKNLTLRQEGSSWKIVREDFARSKRGDSKV